MGASAHLYLALGGLFCLASPTPNAPAAPRPAAGEGHRICWQEGRRLQWSDFCATTYPKSASGNPASSGGLTTSAISATPVTENGIPTYRIACVFVGDSSWVNNALVKTPQERALVLAHEQLHFDIAELSARKIRQHMAQLLRAGKNLYSPQVTQDIIRLQSDDTLDDQLDKSDTTLNPKIVIPEIKRWQLRLAQELNKLAAYKSTATACP